MVISLLRWRASCHSGMGALLYHRPRGARTTRAVYVKEILAVDPGRCGRLKA